MFAIPSSKSLMVSLSVSCSAMSEKSFLPRLLISNVKKLKQSGKSLFLISLWKTKGWWITISFGGMSSLYPSFWFKWYLAFGFRRLAILDLSPAGHQPMCSMDGNYWIVFNGEIYNYLELRTELETLGYIFHSHTDTEVILAAYKYWGIRCLERFIGMWAIAIWDTQKKNLFLARDPFGIKPLYFSYKEGKFAFASEIKALLQLKWIRIAYVI